MARANYVKKARKAVPSAGIKVGDSYYWWKFRYGGKHYSKKPPRQSQLQNSPYLSGAMAIQESIDDLKADSDLKDNVEDIVSNLRDLASECESSRENMPEALQDSETGQLLESRAEACNNAADELEALDLDEFEQDGDKTRDGVPINDDDKTEEEYWQDKLEEVQGISFEIE